MKQYKTVDEYINSYDEPQRGLLEQMRATIKDIVPGEAKEKISYGIPTFTFRGNLVHYGAYDTHIGFYPGSGPIADFQQELSAYQTAKGTVRFPLDKPLPVDLIRDMVKAAVKRNQSKQ